MQEMESLLMNIIGVAAIVAMLCGIWIMWSNIDRELAKIEKSEAAAKKAAKKAAKIAAKKCGRAVNAIPAPCHTASFERVALSKINRKPRAELKLA